MPADEERRLRADEGDAERRGEPAEPDRAEQDALEHAEHPAEDVIRDDALEQRQGGDVGDRVPDPDDGEREQGNGIAGEDADHGERHAEQHDADPEVRGEPAAGREHERHEASHEASDPERRAQVADAGVARVDQLERDEHDEHVERAGDERLRGVEARHRRHVAIAGDGAHALAQLGDRSRGGCRPRRVGRRRGQVLGGRRAAPPRRGTRAH